MAATVRSVCSDNASYPADFHSFKFPFSVSENGSSVAVSDRLSAKSEYFRSRRVCKESIDKPWLSNKRHPREKWTCIIPMVGLLLGLVAVGFQIYLGIQSVQELSFCPVLIENFATGLDSAIWTSEVNLGGFGLGQFEETTNSGENAFVQNGLLYIKPTLQDSSLINQNSRLDLQGHGCTGTGWAECVAVTNVTNGTIINPVKSARINTQKGASIKYGKVEVVAKLPAGDWMWPAIWMMPVNDTYGPWPASGEIDIMESRGNNYTYALGGNNLMSSTLHLGPVSALDQWYHYYSTDTALHSTYADGFHTFGLIWTEDYIFTYVDSQPHQVLYVNFNAPFWERGNYPPQESNGTLLVDPWSQTGRDSTPFDQPFYLILDVGVGGTNGWWKDGAGGKPWVDQSPMAMKDFWTAKDQWLPTWEQDGEMVVKSVKMWQLKGYNGCT